MVSGGCRLVVGIGIEGGGEGGVVMKMWGEGLLYCSGNWIGNGEGRVKCL